MERNFVSSKEEDKEKECSFSLEREKSSPEVEHDDEETMIKRKISCHALYGRLLESHVDCLKLCLGRNMFNIEETQTVKPIEGDDHKKSCSCSVANEVELDHFMEAYCKALKKLKEAMEEPQQESMDFINYMHSQLEELVDIPTSENPNL